MEHQSLTLWIETAFLFFTTFSNAASYDLDGLTMAEMSRRTHSNYEQISETYSADAYGFVVGVIASGAIVQRFPKHIRLVTIVATSLIGLASCVMPWTNRRELLALILSFRGVGRGCNNVVVVKLCGVLWQKNYLKPMTIVWAGWGAGSVVAAQVMTVFLKTPKVNMFNVTVSNAIGHHFLLPPSKHNNSFWWNTTRAEASTLRYPVEWGFAIISTFCLSVALGYSIFTCIIQNKQVNSDTERLLLAAKEVQMTYGAESNQDEPDLEHPTHWQTFKLFCKRGRHWLYIPLLMLIYGTVGAYGQGLVYKFLFWYLIEYARFGVKEAGDVFSAFFLAYSGTRFLVLAVLKYVTCKQLFITFAVLTTLSGISTCFLQFSSQHYMYWIVFITFSLVTSNFPSVLFGMAGELVETPALVISVITLGFPFGASIMLDISGRLFDDFGIQVFPYIILSICGLHTFLSLLLICLSSSNCTKHEKIGK